jgi:hypothetical protein
MLGKALDGGSQNLYRLTAITGRHQARQITRRPEMIEAGPLPAGGFDRFDKRALRLCSTTSVSKRLIASRLPAGWTKAAPSPRRSAKRCRTTPPLFFSRHTASRPTQRLSFSKAASGSDSSRPMTV